MEQGQQSPVIVQQNPENKKVNIRILLIHIYNLSFVLKFVYHIKRICNLK